MKHNTSPGELTELVEAAFQGAADKSVFIGRDYAAVKKDYDAITTHMMAKNTAFEKAAEALSLKFTPADKWVMVKHGLLQNPALNLNDVCRSLEFKYKETEKRVRILLLLREEYYENGNTGVTLVDILDKWRFSMAILNQTLKMFTYLNVLLMEGNEIDARHVAGYASCAVLDTWKKVPEFKSLYLEALERSQHRITARLRDIAQTDGGASSVQALKILMERSDRQMLSELYDSMTTEERKSELRKRAFIMAAEKGTNLKEALKLEDPEEYGGLDDVNILLPDGLADKITADAPTHLLLQMQQLLEQYNNNST